MFYYVIKRGVIGRQCLVFKTRLVKTTKFII